MRLRDAPAEVPPARSRGEVALRRLLAELRPSELGRRLGVSRATASAWGRGEKQPGSDAVVRLTELGIPRTWWREAPIAEVDVKRKVGRPKAGGKSAASGTLSQSRDDAADEGLTEREAPAGKGVQKVDTPAADDVTKRYAPRRGRPQTLEDLDALEQQVRAVADDQRSLPETRLKALSELRQIARLRESVAAARLKAEVDAEDLFVRMSPRWRRICDAISESMRRHLSELMQSDPRVREAFRKVIADIEALREG